MSLAFVPDKNALLASTLAFHLTHLILVLHSKHLHGGRALVSANQIPLKRATERAGHLHQQRRNTAPQDS